MTGDKENKKVEDGTKKGEKKNGKGKPQQNDAKGKQQEKHKQTR